MTIAVKDATTVPAVPILPNFFSMSFTCVNHAQVLGNVTADPRINTTKKTGNAVANFSMATNDSYKSKEGEEKKVVDYHNVVVWYKPLVALVEKYVKKGSRIFIQGKMKTKVWADENGKNSYMMEIVAEKLILLDKKQDDSQDSGDIPPDRVPTDDEVF